MKHILSVPFICMVSLLFSSCEKKELPVAAHDPGNVITTTADMDPSYKWQLYFNLKNNTVVGKNLKTAWDIGFETSAQGYHVVLNTSKSMFALSTGKTDFAAVSYADTTGFEVNKRWDSPAGEPDSTAITDWRATSPVYIIDRGYNELGGHMGRVKVQFTSVSDSSYNVRTGPLNNSTNTTLTIRKDSAYNFIFLSFDNGGQVVTIEPPKAEWDLVFTQYTHIFYDPFTPYLVTGCLLNRYKVAAYSDTAAAFSQITFGAIDHQKLSTAINVIGYDWKVFSGTTYITNTKITYIIRDVNGLYYKLHFTDFYNTSGVKGNPKWEYQRL